MRNLFLTVLIALCASSFLSCGKDNCFSVGPFGDCDDKYPDSTKTGTRTGGALKAQTVENKQVFTLAEAALIKIEVSGGVGPYELESVGSNVGTQVSQSGQPTNDLASPYFKFTSTGSAEIRVEDSASPKARTSVLFKVQ